GHVDFTMEVERSLRVLDGAIALLDAVAGVEPQTETVWRQADKYRVPRVVYVNKMDRVGADFFRCLAMIKSRLGANGVAIQIPVGREDGFVGVVDLIEEVALIWKDDDSLGQNFERTAVPADLAPLVREYRDKLIESLAEVDDHLLEKYLGDHKISPAEVRAAVRAGTISRKIFPVLCGASFKNKGVQPMLDAVVDYLPSPLDVPPIRGLKDTRTGDTLCDPNRPIVLESMDFPEPVIAVAIEPKTKADEEKLGLSLQRLALEDPTFKVKVDEETSQTLISGMGELHLEIIVDRLLREFKVEANVGKPEVAYRETIR